MSTTPQDPEHADGPVGGRPDDRQRQQPTIPTPVPGRAPEVFERLARAVDDVLAFEWDAESCADKTAGLVALSTQVDRLSVADAAGIRSLAGDPGWAAEGFKTVVSKVAYETNQSRATARRRRRDAKQLLELPALADALADGEITGDAARLILRADTAALHDQMVRDHKLLVDQARHLEHADFAQAMRYWVQLADTDEADKAAAEREATRSVHLSRSYDGRYRLDGWLSVLGGAEIKAEIERLEQVLYEMDWAQAREIHGDATNPTHLARTAEQRRHDALVELTRRSAALEGDELAPSAKWVLNLHMDYPTFIAEWARHTGQPFDYPADRLCELDDGTVIAPSEALNAALAGEIRRVVFGADGHVLDYGRSRRLFTKAQAGAISARDRRCQEPGCLLPAAKCQVDHVDEHHAGGATNVRNGEMRCRFHNVWKHLNPKAWRRQRWRHEQRFDRHRLPDLE